MTNILDSFALKKYSNQIESNYTDDGVGAINKADANYYGNSRTFNGYFGSTSVRSDYNRGDYEFFRPSDRTPRSDSKKIEMALRAYENIGIIRNVIDLMADFACAGVRLVHQNQAEEKFYNAWWEQVNGDYISERFLNYLYRMANVVVNKTYAKIPVSTAQKWKSTYGGNFDGPSIEKRRIPYKYNFINPLSVEVVGGEFSTFVGVQRYALKIGSVVKSAYDRMKAEYKNLNIKEYVDVLPEDIRDAIQKGGNLIPLDPDNVSVYYYKKDDWRIWAVPMIQSIYHDIIELEKLKLADISALDGAISNIRLWRVGIIGDTPQTSIIPTKAMLNKLRNVIASNVGGGVMDLVMGPEVDFKESSTQVHNFLGPDKYKPTIAAIYEGLGVPYSGDSGFSNNFIMMQTLVERLEYGRRILKDFWNKEIRIVQKAMGFTKPAEVVFDMINLGDDASYKKLLVDLADRDIISYETLLTNLRMFTKAEKSKIKKEYKERRKFTMPDKASPFHNPQTDHDLAKIILQGGGVAPSELGIELQPKKDGEQSLNEQRTDMQIKVAEKTAKFKPVGGDVGNYKPIGKSGRPDQAKDSFKRKKRQEKPKAKADFINRFVWANAAQKEISAITLPAIVEGAFGKKNLRQLTDEEFDTYEVLNYSVLCNLQPFSKIDLESVYTLLGNNPKIPDEILSSAKYLKSIFKTKNDREPTIDEMRQIQSSAFALYHEEVETYENEFSDLGDING